MLSEWHALAKLRMHTDDTIKHLQQGTKELGQYLRRFRDKLCPSYSTKELLREKEARLRRKAPAGSSTTTKMPDPNAGSKYFNLMTYKLHALGDYVSTIIQFGTTDSYSTQTVR